MSSWKPHDASRRPDTENAFGRQDWFKAKCNSFIQKLWTPRPNNDYFDQTVLLDMGPWVSMTWIFVTTAPKEPFSWTHTTNCPQSRSTRFGSLCDSSPYASYSETQVISERIARDACRHVSGLPLTVTNERRRPKAPNFQQIVNPCPVVNTRRRVFDAATKATRRTHMRHKGGLQVEFCRRRRTMIRPMPSVIGAIRGRQSPMMFNTTICFLAGGPPGRIWCLPMTLKWL
jgi:hypothetical protein